MVVALAPVAVAARRGAAISTHTVATDARTAAARREAGWECLERRIAALVPAGAEVVVPMDQPLLNYQRALEMVAPHARVVDETRQAGYELRLRRARGSTRCSTLVPQVRRLGPEDGAG
jgi:hypothetical protein